MRGNSPATSKFEIFKLFPEPNSRREAMSFISFDNFYLHWVPYFKERITPLRSSTTLPIALDQRCIPTDFNNVCKNTFTNNPTHDIIAHFTNI